MTQLGTDSFCVKNDTKRDGLKMCQTFKKGLNKMINLTIDGLNVSVPEGTTILEAARTAGIDIPTLCFLKDIHEAGDCRMCIVEVEGRKGFATSCIQKVEEGMVVKTNSKDVSEAREVVLDLILSNHH